MIEDNSTMITKKEAFLHIKITQQLQQQIFHIIMSEKAKQDRQDQNHKSVCLNKTCIDV